MSEQQFDPLQPAGDYAGWNSGKMVPASRHGRRALFQHAADVAVDVAGAALLAQVIDLSFPRKSVPVVGSLGSATTSAAPSVVSLGPAAGASHRIEPQPGFDKNSFRAMLTIPRFGSPRQFSLPFLQPGVPALAVGLAMESSAGARAIGYIVQGPCALAFWSFDGFAQPVPGFEMDATPLIPEGGGIPYVVEVAESRTRSPFAATDPMHVAYSAALRPVVEDPATGQPTWPRIEQGMAISIPGGVLSTVLRYCVWQVCLEGQLLPLPTTTVVMARMLGETKTSEYVPHDWASFSQFGGKVPVASARMGGGQLTIDVDPKGIQPVSQEMNK